MITAFGLMLDRCGLSQREAASLLGVRLDTIKGWGIGRSAVPHGALQEMRRLYACQRRAASEALDVIAKHHLAQDVIELSMSADDYEAQQLGWPCCGAHGAVLGMVIADTDAAIRIVPRGSTAATAAAEI